MTVSCNECKSEIKMPQKHGTTSNPIRHLKGRHMELYEEFKSGKGGFKADPDGEDGSGYGSTLVRERGGVIYFVQCMICFDICTPDGEKREGIQILNQIMH